MKCRVPPSASPTFAAAVACVLLALPVLAGCGHAAAGRPDPSTTPPATPSGRQTPQPSKASTNPDDINGDGYRDLLVPVTVGGFDRKANPAGEERVGVVFGSAHGLDPAVRSVWSRADLGLPAPDVAHGVKDTLPAAAVVTADLDGDGFPDFVTVRSGPVVEENGFPAARAVPYVSWGGPAGPTPGVRATPLRMPGRVANLGISTLVRGDFDGDGHHDLAGPAADKSSLVVLYGPFGHSGAPARTDTRLPWLPGSLVADAIDPSGKPRATSLLVHDSNDGEQSGNTLFVAHRGTGLAAPGTVLRGGNAHAFGDFDGDGVRDVVVGDDRSRNNEDGPGTEPGEGDGSLTVYPGSGTPPVVHRRPDVPEGLGTDYGPGGFTAADPDGDGRDGILVATYQGATLIDGDRRTTVLRQGPATVGGEHTPAKWLHARPVGAGDFDGDGRDELVLAWAPGLLFGLYGEHPAYWWITDGTGSRDRTSFVTDTFAPE
ncbi:FG-GAP repeat domain-containing protein [Streptomyces sp. NPDC002667]|uniref:FG-GAP repeat domain-containing protein n=1 Tax=Streptomyces sp. NPDC002667 TaxID=3364657 RepID=UPI00368645AE